MKTKIIGTLVCTLLIAFTLPVFGIETEDNIENELNKFNTSMNEHNKNAIELSNNRFNGPISPLGFIYESYVFGTNFNLTTYGKTTCLYMELPGFYFNIMILCFNENQNEIVAKFNCESFFGTINRTYTGAFGMNIIFFSGTMNIDFPNDVDGGNIKGNAFLFRIPKYG